jgi:predicted aconitase with swiveling domain
MANKVFKGRVITAGDFIGEAVVSHQGVNTLATFEKSAIMRSKHVKVSDQNNPDIFNKDITNKILCLPLTIGSTTGGMVIQTICNMGSNPRAFLFSEPADSIGLSGIILAKVWQNSNVICLDSLGDEFLKTVKTGDKLEIKSDGTVTILS